MLYITPYYSSLISLFAPAAGGAEDVALDCLKMPASRRPSMREVARRLHGLLAQYCTDDGPEDSQASPRVERERAFVGAGGGENSTTGLFDSSLWSEGLIE
ncbi:unnamed protein product [Closterium sp. Naga37s-1]|nr:unnamed protein product [Closterium sp. Naga37s-1]